MGRSFPAPVPFDTFLRAVGYGRSLVAGRYVERSGAGSVFAGMDQRRRHLLQGFLTGAVARGRRSDPALAGDYAFCFWPAFRSPARQNSAAVSRLSADHLGGAAI